MYKPLAPSAAEGPRTRTKLGVANTPFPAISFPAPSLPPILSCNTENRLNDPSPTHSLNHYMYQPLAAGHIRVFELAAGKPSDPIVGRLVPQKIDGEPYEAVSYVWGDPRSRRDVMINGITHSVTENLHGALTAFRHGHRVRRLWADALCINQADLPERTVQVELMGPIFAGARRVIAWLGWEEGEEGLRHVQTAFRFIHSFMQDPEAGLRRARILLLHHDITVTGAASRLDILSEEDHRQFEEQAQNWVAVKKFFEIKYFHRAWIVQEVGLAREASMYTGLRPAHGDHRLDMDFIDWPLVGRFVNFLDFRGASLVTHLDLLSWVADHILMVWEKNEDGTPKYDFLTAMHWVRILGVTDARDRIFSLLGHPLAVIDGQPVIKPDYTVTRGVVYTKLAANFIRQTRNLQAVNLVDHDEHPSTEAKAWDPQDDSRMPSWVPDWHGINRTTPLDYPIASAEWADVDIRIDGDMEGEEGTPLPHLLARGWIVDEVSAVSHRMETTDFPVTHLAREQAKEHPFWLDSVWDVVFLAGSAKAESQGHDALSLLETLSLALPLGTIEEGQPASKSGHLQPLGEHQKSFAAYVLEYHKLRQSVSEDSAIDGTSNLPARSLYDSLPAEAQAELRRRAEGATGVEFLESMTWSSMCRVVYRTASGLVGMGSRITRPGDLVCRVRGSPVLMTLRRIETGSAESPDSPIPCVFIGPTVVPARTKSGIVDGGEFGEKAARFRIM